MFHEGYKFWLVNKTEKSKYFRCCRHKCSKCPAKLIIDDGTKRITQGEHNHPQEANKVIVDNFRKVLTKRAANESTELYAIYCEEATTRHSEAAMIYTFPLAESAMRKARRKLVAYGQIDCVNVNDIIPVLNTSDLFQVNYGNCKDSIYQKTITTSDSSCMIFMHQKTFELFKRVSEIHIDCSLQFTQKNQQQYFMISVHFVEGDLISPIIYAILTAKTPSVLNSFFEYISRDLKLAPNIVITNFDSSMHSSLSYAFPESTIKGNWFEFTKSVLHQQKTLEMERYTSKGLGASGLKMILMLPLLPPEYIVPGLEAIKKWLKDKVFFDEKFSRLCDFVEQTWLRTVGSEKISIFGSPKVFVNHVRTFNKELIDIIENQNPVIWVILEAITQITTKNFNRILRRMKEAPKQSKKNLVSETILQNATQQWVKTPVHLRSPLQFLQATSHCINDSMYLSTLSDVKQTPALEESQRTTPTTTSMDSYNCRDIVSSEKDQHFPSCCGSSQTQRELPIIQECITYSATEPPPLVYFKQKLYTSQEPPPLVPINYKRRLIK